MPIYIDKIPINMIINKQYLTNMEHKVGIIVFTLIIIATIAAATDYLKVNQTTTTTISQTGETKNFPAPEVVSTLAAVVLTSPTFGYLLIKSKNGA